MDASSDLNGKLQKISALMGLLRSDILELSQAKDTMQRIPVVAHVNWIADQLDAASATLSNPPDARGPGAKRNPTSARARTPDARRRASSHSADRDTKHKNSEDKDTARRNTAHRDTKLHGSGPGAPQPDHLPGDDKTAISSKSHDIKQPDDPRQPDVGSNGLPQSDAAPFVPPIPDVPKPEEDPSR
ncbi:hypothetical protein [Kaistia terrae]|uniref:Uncharacterized protein n=1 Tax=Kaistia terrae TaxID=537017 RepID=A0ABW0PZ62_9HYPH|nr:hypothetical protein [Kaistia terrae]MCX5580349.1 hypothetical protein [Kaistia terrae]